jgi:hypothetical protein
MILKIQAPEVFQAGSNMRARQRKHLLALLADAKMRLRRADDAFQNNSFGTQAHSTGHKDRIFFKSEVDRLTDMLNE